MMINSLTECCIMRHDVKLVTRCIHHKGFPGGSVVKNPPANAEDAGSIPGLGRSLGVGNDNQLQYSCLKNSLDRGAWWATVHRVTTSQTQLNTHTHTDHMLQQFHTSGYLAKGNKNTNSKDICTPICITALFL